jgi:hypothetical protein
MKKSVLFSAAVAGMLLAPNAFAKTKKAATKSGAEATGQCHGINSCKGKGECAGQDHGCAGSNECKGKGWVTMTKTQCLAKKGKFKADGK